jgi:electron transport complex protein RnfB
VSELAARIDAILPQTQCTQCGYAGCRPYADAVARGTADIDRCPPGGDEGVAKLAALLGRAAKPLDPACGVPRAPQVAFIDEALCIGCVKCIRACPVDAIVGASKRMHTVIAAWCTGCELCLPPCPVDCIALLPAAALPDPDRSRERHAFRAFRLARTSAERAARMETYETPAAEDPTP